MCNAKSIHVHISLLYFCNFDTIRKCAEGLFSCPKNINNYSVPITNAIELENDVDRLLWRFTYKRA